MLELDEVEEILEELASELPQPLFNKLNGGIILLPEVKVNPVGSNNDLYILGEYHSGGNMDRYIAIYYGSFIAVYGHLSKEALKKQLAQTLKHEFIHHLESLAGERDLIKEDEKFLKDYLRRKSREGKQG
jgi:predicted Zn-dependent protease with MMP-like domain